MLGSGCAYGGLGMRNLHATPRTWHMRTDKCQSTYGMQGLWYPQRVYIILPRQFLPSFYIFFFFYEYMIWRDDCRNSGAGPLYVATVEFSISMHNRMNTCLSLNMHVTQH